MKRTPLIIKTGFVYPKIAGKSQPGLDLDRYIADYLYANGLPVFDSCCPGGDILDQRLVTALVEAGFQKV